jgi:hypothetical protein
MSRCPYCNHILKDEWLRSHGAAALGRAGGPAKARGAKQASDAAKERWRSERQWEKALDIADPQSKAMLDKASIEESVRLSRESVKKRKKRLRKDST